MQKNLLNGENLELAAAILSCIGDGIISTDLSGRIIYMNRMAEEIIDWSANKAIGKEFDKIFSFFNEDTKKRIKSPIINVLEKDTIVGLEDNTVIITKNNVKKYVSATCSVVKTVEGSTIGAVVVLRDITKIKTLETVLQNEKNNLTTIFNYAPVGMAMLDEKAQIIQVNDAALLIDNRKREQVLGKNFGDSFHCIGSIEDERGCGHGQECTKCELRRAIALAVENGQATSNIEIFKILILNRKEKEFWFRVSITPLIIRGKRNAVITLMDITESKNKEINIVKSRDFCNNILDQIPSLVWKTNAKVECNYVNKVWSDYTGCNLEECMGYGWSNIIHPEDLDKYVIARTNAMYTMEAFQIEFRLRRHDNEFRWCLAVASPYFDLDGRYAGYIGSIYDINDRKTAEDNLRRYRKIIDNARDIILFIDLDGWILEANKSAVEAYGYSDEELCTMNIRNIRDSWGYTEQQMEQANRTGLFFEAIHRRKDGSTFEVEVSSQGTNIGKNRILFSVVRDITERKKAERNVFEHQLKYRSLFMNMQTGYAYYKLQYDDKHLPSDLLFTEVNEAFEKLMCKTKKQIIGKTHLELFPSSKDIIIDYIVKYSYKLYRGESIHIDELYSNILDKWFSIAIYSPKENDIVTIITDISQIKQTQKKLITARDAAEAANKAKSEFLANMSHEIRTPINGMVGMVDLTLLTDLTIDQRDNLITAKACASSLLKIINDILDFSKMEAGKLVIENVNFDLKSLIEEIVKTHSPRVEDKGLDLNYTLSSTIPQFLIGDPNRLRQVLNNLISNAMKFTHKGDITITVKKIANIKNEVELQFIVSDTGIGIDSEDIGQLFMSFSQVEDSYTKKYGGTGLGLAISKNLIEMMGGRIGADSEKGKGSNFYFYLKFKLGHRIEEKINRLPVIAKTVKPLNILLVEDDLINQRVILKMLIAKGHGVKTADNGKEALELYLQGSFDIILMDIQMPEMNGIEATKRIRESEINGKHTPIVALTAYALHGDREIFLSLGMDGYVSKPIQMSELFYTLERLTLYHDGCDTSTPNKVVLEKNGDVLFANTKLHQSSDNLKNVMNEIAVNTKKMVAAMENDDLLIIENMAHEVKTLANEIDAVDIKDAAFKVELAARRGNLVEAIENMEKIKSELIIYHNSDV